MASVTMGVLWDTGDMEKASIYSVASEKGDAGAARADAAKRAGGARCGAGEARRRGLRLPPCRLPARLQCCSLWVACGNRGGPPVASAGMGESFAHGAFHACRAFRGAAPAALPPGLSGAARTRLHDVAFHRPAVHAAAFRGAEGREGCPGLAGSCLRGRRARAAPASLWGPHGAAVRGAFPSGRSPGIRYGGALLRSFRRADVA